MEKSQKIVAKYIFKGEPGYYGKGGKEMNVDDIVEVKSNSGYISSIQTPIGIYHRKSSKYLNQNKILNILFIICILCIISLKFVLYDFFISPKQKNLETLLSNLCFAFVASYIFYTIVVKRTDKIKKRDAYAVVCGLIESLLVHGRGVERWILMANGMVNDKLDSINFKEMCAQIDINKIPNQYQTNYGDLIIFDGVKKIKYYIDKIFTYMPFLESELLHHLNKIQNCKFSRHIGILPYKQDSSLKEFGTDILEFLSLLQDLEIYNEKLKSKYLKNYEKRF